MLSHDPPSFLSVFFVVDAQPVGTEEVELVLPMVSEQPLFSCVVGRRVFVLMVGVRWSGFVWRELCVKLFLLQVDGDCV